MSRRHRTNRIRTPRPRPAREAAPTPTDPVLPLRDFDVMVRVWLSVHKRAAPTVVKAFQAAGWRCEEVASLPNAVIGPGEGDLRSHWEVDVPLPGGASRATAEAERQIRTKVAQLGTVMACRGSVVLEPEGIHALTFRVHRIPPNPQGRHYWLRYLDRWRVKSGRLDTGQIVHAHSLTHARAEYRRRAGLPGLPTPVGNVDLRPEAFAPRNAHPTPGRYPLRESQAEALRIAAIPTAGAR